MRATEKVHQERQSVWLDNITRRMLDSGQIARDVEQYSVTGLRQKRPTSRPTRRRPTLRVPQARLERSHQCIARMPEACEVNKADEVAGADDQGSRFRRPRLSSLMTSIRWEAVTSICPSPPHLNPHSERNELDWPETLRNGPPADLPSVTRLLSRDLPVLGSAPQPSHTVEVTGPNPVRPTPVPQHENSAAPLIASRQSRIEPRRRRPRRSWAAQRVKRV
jgi:hypothetical protein